MNHAAGTGYVHDFATIETPEIPRSKFDCTSGLSTTFDEDYLIPIYLKEVNPGDVVEMESNLFARLQSQIVPTLDQIKLKAYWFYCPSRILWTGFTKLMGERDEVSAMFTDPDPIPQISLTTYDSSNNPHGLLGSQTLGDYLGIPDPGKGTYASGKSVSVNSLPFRMYNKVWNDWFRAGNLQDISYFNPDDSDDDEENYGLLKINKVSDYFTSCNPWPQKSSAAAAITFGMNATAPVVGDGVTGLGLIGSNGVTATGFDGVLTSAQFNYLYPSAGAVTTQNGAVLVRNSSERGVGKSVVGGSDRPSVDTILGVSPDPNKSGLVAKLNNVSVATVNALRSAIAVQHMLELDARAGNNRYIEILRSHFGVTSPDARLQRSELLASDTVDIQVNPVVQTSSTDATTPQANLAAFATAAGDSGSFSKAFTEHGYIMCLVAAKSNITYSQGLKRMWSRKNRLDFMFPSLARLGEQEVLNKEIYLDWDGADSTNDQVFGYNERYSEFRSSPYMITGKLRPGITGNIEQWTLSEAFASCPQLNGDFMKSSSPISRLVAVVNEPHFILDVHFGEQYTTSLPVYGTPGLTRL